MTSSNTLKKLVSIGAAMLLAVGGSLVAAEPASAAVLTSVALGGGSHIQASMTTFSLGAVGCNTYTGTIDIADWQMTVNGGTQTLSSVTLSGYMVIHLSAALAGGETVTLSYTKNNSRVITCDSGDTIGTFTYTDTAPVPASITGTPSVTVASNIVTAAPATAVGGVVNQYWFVCAASKSATSTTLAGAPISGISGCFMLFNTAGTSSAVQTNTLDLRGTYYIRMGTSPTYTYPAAVLAGQNVLFAQVLNSLIAYSSSVSGDVATTTPTTPTVISEAAKPLPVWAAPILKQIPTLSKTLNTDGGKVSLTDGDFSSLTTVTVGGKEVTFSTDAKGNVNIPIPAGAAGTTADLVVTFTGGKMVIQDGIKYVAPTDVAKVAEAGVAGFKANSSKVSGALAASILYAAQIDHKANAIACSGYAASKAQVALATARAQAACDYATGAYSNLTKSTVAVIVNKAKAKSASVGIKVYH
jgi:hypothetical protein